MISGSLRQWAYIGANTVAHAANFIRRTLGLYTVKYSLIRQPTVQYVSMPQIKLPYT